MSEAPLTVLHLVANRWWTGSAEPVIRLSTGLRARGHRVRAEGVAARRSPGAGRIGPRRAGVPVLPIAADGRHEAERRVERLRHARGERVQPAPGGSTLQPHADHRVHAGALRLG